MTNVDDSTVSSIAPLQNVALVSKALERVMKRRDHLPGLITFYGPAGYGKTWAAIYAANQYQAYYIEAKEYWTRKALLEAILKEMGINPDRTISKMADQVAEQLSRSDRPLIIDEFDHIVRRKLVEMVRSIYEGSNAPILIIGEERVPTMLKQQSERFHSRMLGWVPAQPPDLDDARLIRKLYVTDVKIKDDVLQAMLQVVNGSVRRVTINLEKVREYALEHGLETIGMAEWKGQEFDTGEALPRRV